MSRRVVVTGAQGFIGRMVVAELLERGATVAGLGRSPHSATHYTHKLDYPDHCTEALLPPSLRTLPESHYLRCDLANPEATREAMAHTRPDVVIHLAGALRRVTPESMRCVNIEGAHSLANALLEAPVKPRRLVVASTCGVYRARTSGQLSEGSRTGPTNEYGRTKLAAEKIFRRLAGHDIEVILARIFNVTGPGQDSHHVSGRFAAQLSSIRAASVPPILHTGSLSSTRDFIDVRDTAEILVKLVELPTAIPVVNVGSGVGTRIRDLLDSMLDISGLAGSVEIREEPSGPSSITHFVADTTALSEACGSSLRDIRSSVADLLNYYDRARRAPCSSPLTRRTPHAS